MTIQEMQQRKRELGLTYEQISERSGVSVPTVQRILSGTTEHPREYTKALIEAVLLDLRQTLGVREKPAFAYMTKKQGEYTADDYFELPDEERCELIDGVIYDLASPTSTHQIIAGEIHRQFSNHVQKNGGKCIPFISPLDIKLSDRTVVQPDVMIACDPKKRDLKGNPMPTLVVEIVSPSSRKNDYYRKLIKYEESGIKEYWIVDTKRNIVTVYDLSGKNDIDVETYGLYDDIPVSIWDGRCVVNLTPIDRYLSVLEQYAPENTDEDYDE